MPAIGGARGPTFANLVSLRGDALTTKHERQELLRAYKMTIDFAESLPPVVGIGRSKGKRLLPLPWNYIIRVWFLRYFLVAHTKGHLDYLRRCYATRIASGDGSDDDEVGLRATELFGNSLPQVAHKRLMFLLGAGGFLLLTSVMWPDGASLFLQAGRAVIDRDVVRGQEVASSLHWRDAIFYYLALFIVGMLPTAAFCLKRMLLNLYPDAETKLGTTGIMDHAGRAEGVYEKERDLYSALSVRAIAEQPLDLIFLSIYIAPLLYVTFWAVLGAAATRGSVPFVAVAAVLAFPTGTCLWMALRAWGSRSGGPLPRWISPRRISLGFLAAGICTVVVGLIFSAPLNRPPQAREAIDVQSTRHHLTISERAVTMRDYLYRKGIARQFKSIDGDIVRYMPKRGDDTIGMVVTYDLGFTYPDCGCVLWWSLFNERSLKMTSEEVLHSEYPAPIITKPSSSDRSVTLAAGDVWIPRPAQAGRYFINVEGGTVRLKGDPADIGFESEAVWLPAAPRRT